MNTRMCFVRWLDGMEFRCYVEWGKVEVWGKILEGNEKNCLNFALQVSILIFMFPSHGNKWNWIFVIVAIIAHTKKLAMLNVSMFQCFRELFQVRNIRIEFSRFCRSFFMFMWKNVLKLTFSRHISSCSRTQVAYWNETWAVWKQKRMGEQVRMRMEIVNSRNEKSSRMSSQKTRNEGT